MPLSFEKVVKCVSTAMNVHSVITVTMIDPAETKCKGDSSTSKVVIEKQKRLCIFMGKVYHLNILKSEESPASGSTETVNK